MEVRDGDGHRGLPRAPAALRRLDASRRASSTPGRASRTPRCARCEEETGLRCTLEARAARAPSTATTRTGRRSCATGRWSWSRTSASSPTTGRRGALAAVRRGGRACSATSATASCWLAGSGVERRRRAARAPAAGPPRAAPPRAGTPCSRSSSPIGGAHELDRRRAGRRRRGERQRDRRLAGHVPDRRVGREVGRIRDSSSTGSSPQGSIAPIGTGRCRQRRGEQHVVVRPRTRRSGARTAGAASASQVLRAGELLEALLEQPPRERLDVVLGGLAAGHRPRVQHAVASRAQSTREDRQQVGAAHGASNSSTSWPSDSSSFGRLACAAPRPSGRLGPIGSVGRDADPQLAGVAARPRRRTAPAGGGAQVASPGS